MTFYCRQLQIQFFADLCICNAKSDILKNYCLHHCQFLFHSFIRQHRYRPGFTFCVTQNRLEIIFHRHSKNFENFDFSRVTGEHAAQIKSLPNLTALYSRQNIAFIDPPGVGKTHLSMAYGNACCHKGLKAYFIKATELNEKFTNARRTGTESSAVSGWVRPSCLIIDEIGKSIFDVGNTRLFFDMINRRCSKEEPNCMIFTSNLTPDKWRDFFSIYFKIPSSFPFRVACTLLLTPSFLYRL